MSITITLYWSSLANPETDRAVVAKVAVAVQFHELLKRQAQVVGSVGRFLVRATWTGLPGIQILVDPLRDLTIPGRRRRNLVFGFRPPVRHRSSALRRDSSSWWAARIRGPVQVPVSPYRYPSSSVGCPSLRCGSLFLGRRRPVTGPHCISEA